jgi:hypothetical protein
MEESMQQHASNKRTFYVFLGTLVAVSILLYFGMRIETKNLIIQRGQIVIHHAEESTILIEKMIALAQGPKKGDLEYFRPIHEELLGQTPSLASLDEELSTNETLLRITTLDGRFTIDEFKPLVDAYTLAHYSYVSAKETIRVLKNVMDANAYEYKITATKMKLMKEKIQNLKTTIELYK